MVTLPIHNRSESYTVAPSKIIALGLNYRDHIKESRSVKVQGFTEEIPEEPILFPKTPNVLIGPGEPIVIPAFLSEYAFDEPRVDYEAELAMVIGTALIYLFGVSWLVTVYAGKGMTIGKGMAVGMIPFLPGDLLKIIAAAAIAKSLRPVLRIPNIKTVQAG